jgi:pSer/pThr/pTyr-binding forkhead associated (FHA) protein
MKLVFRSGPRADEEIQIDREMVVGRDGADIEIEDSAVSRQHARLRPAGDTLEIEDLGSTNGTYVNGSKIDEPAIVRPGDFVNIGQSTLEIGGVDWRLAETRALAMPPSGQEEQGPPTSEEYRPTAPMSVGTGSSSSPLSSVPREWILGAVALLVVSLLGFGVYALIGGSSDEDFLNDADAICESLQSALDDVHLAAGAEPTTLKREAGRLLKARSSVAESLRELEVPEDLRSRFRKYLDRVDATNSKLRVVQRLKAKSKRKAIEGSVLAVRKAAEAETKAARDVGLEQCGGLPV